VYQSKEVAEFLSPQGNRRGGLRTDFDHLRKEALLKLHRDTRERVLVLNDSIRAVSCAGEFLMRANDDEGALTASIILNCLLEEFDQSAFEEVEDG